MRKTVKYIFMAIVIGLGVVVFFEQIEPAPKMIEAPQPKIICYSCGRGENPENTLKGIRHCQSVNADWRVEMDIQITADEQLVLFHDYNTKRITGEDRLVNELNLKEIKALNAGYNFKVQEDFIYRTAPIKIPTLREVFNEFPQAKLLLDIHTNNPRVIDILLDLIDSEFEEGDFIIASEYDEIIKAIKQKRPNWRYGVPAIEAKKMLYSSFIFLDGLFPIQSDILMVPKNYGKINVLSNRVINHAKKRNKEVWAWMYEGEVVKTVNSKDDLEVLKKLGIDGVFTDAPAKLNNELL